MACKDDTVFVFDFDKTIIGCDSDNWVVEGLGFNDLFNHLLPTLPWNSLMDRMMTEIWSDGKTIGDVAESLKRAPIDPNIISAIESAHAFGCDLRILSDANEFFIETILKHNGLMGCFKEIITNPSLVGEEGRLRISPYHDFNASSHGCNICPPNMCKGVVLEKMRASLLAEGKKRVVYVGDGTADFCAGLKLEESDFMLPRKDFPVWDMICKNPMLIKAKICEWSDWEELETVLLTTRADQAPLLDCKFQDSNSLSSAHQNALRIPQ